MIRGISGIREAYQDEATVRTYIDDRFVQPLGAMLHRRQAAALHRAIRRARPRDVLEIAPGPARLTIEVARVLHRPGTLIDASLPMLMEARARLARVTPVQWRYVRGDAFSLPFRGRFDLVYAFRLIRHFEPADRQALYAQIREVLRPGGLLLFDAVNEVIALMARASTPAGELRHYDALMRPATLHAELAEAGLELLGLEGVQRRYDVLSRIQVLVAPRSRIMARAAMEVLDRFGAGEPMEWIATCRRA